MPPWLFVTWDSSAGGELKACCDVGEALFGVCEFDAVNEASSASSGASDPFLDRAPIRLCFSLNFSSQLVLRDDRASGEVAENA